MRNIQNSAPSRIQTTESGFTQPERIPCTGYFFCDNGKLPESGREEIFWERFKALQHTPDNSNAHIGLQYLQKDSAVAGSSGTSLHTTTSCGAVYIG